MLFKQNQKIILIGDSITEDGRLHDPANLGLSYVRLVHDYFQACHPEMNLNIINKGNSGDRVTDLEKRWDRDVIIENPDWVSVSIGVNDVWRQLDRLALKQVYADEFERIYRRLLMDVTKKTNAKLIIMDPTVIGEDRDSKGNDLLKEYVNIVHKLKDEFQAVHIPLHETFLDYITKHPDNKLTQDGVHMNGLGRMLMATTWIEEIKGK